MLKQLARVKKLVAYAAGVGSELIALGVLHGSALAVVSGLIAAATGAGIYRATNAK